MPARRPPKVPADLPPTMTEAAFGKLHQVARKTVTAWKARGLLVLSGELVDVARSNGRLVAAGFARVRAVEGAGRGDRPTPALAPPAPLPASRDRLIGELHQHVPAAEAETLVQDLLAGGRQAAAVLADRLLGPPPGASSWAQDPLFLETVSGAEEWSELLGRMDGSTLPQA